MNTVTITAPRTVVKPEQTASRDHRVELIPGTYELRVIRYGVEYDGTKLEGKVKEVWASIPANAPERRESSVELGGVPLAFRTVPASIEFYSLHLYGYQLETYTVDEIHIEP